MLVARRSTAAAVVAGSLTLGLLTLASCDLGSSASTAPTSTIPSTAFRTIPVSPPRPTSATIAAAATTTTIAGGAALNAAPADPRVKAIYTVKLGDAPASIAARYNVALDALYAANGIDPSRPSIHPGQKLKIPRVLPPTTVLPTGEKAYVVVYGDSPAGIANKFGISLQTLLDLNNLDLATVRLKPGQLLKVPG